MSAFIYILGGLMVFYLLFTLPRAREILEHHGFSVEVRSRVFPRFPTAKLVLATR